jgi:hypothetical protein
VQEKQIYAPLKNEYLASFEKALGQQASLARRRRGRREKRFTGVGLTCHFHPM